MQDGGESVCTKHEKHFHILQNYHFNCARLTQESDLGFPLFGNAVPSFDRLGGKRSMGADRVRQGLWKL
jgi:hypothetical protein